MVNISQGEVWWADKLPMAKLELVLSGVDVVLGR
jgi:hypothetical protein